MANPWVTSVEAGLQIEELKSRGSWSIMAHVLPINPIRFDLNPLLRKMLTCVVPLILAGVVAELFIHGLALFFIYMGLASLLAILAAIEDVTHKPVASRYYLFVGILGCIGLALISLMIAIEVFFRIR